MFRKLKEWRNDRKGVSAVEFSLILPVLMVLLFGTIETTQALTADRKITLVVRSMADLASQASTLTSDEYKNILDAAVAVLQPYSSSKANFKVTGVSIDIFGVATVAWSTARNTTAASCGAIVSIATELKPPLGTTGFVVLAESTYVYTPTVGYTITGPLSIKDQIYMRPRLGSTVSFSGPAPCAAA